MTDEQRAELRLNAYMAVGVLLGARIFGLIGEAFGVANLRDSLLDGFTLFLLISLARRR